jgi:hypothetical protein
MKPPRPRHRQRRLLVPGVLAVSVLAVGLVALVRGTRAEEARDPAAAADGPVCAVCPAPGGGKEVRCAARLPYSLDRVWEAVTDYDHYGDVCECIHAQSVRHEPDGRCLLDARARSLLSGTVPFAVELRHEQNLDEYVAWWDQPSGRVVVNRGRWVLRPAGPSETLLSLSLEVQVRGVPTFLLRNLSLHRLREVVRAVERRLRDGPSGKTW